MIRIIAIAAVMSVLFIASYLHADASEIQPGGVVLTIDMTKDDGTPGPMFKLTLADLQACPEAKFATTTIWTDGQQEFAGVWMHTLLQHLMVTDGLVELIAINDYRISVPVSEFMAGGALLAYERNGSRMTARENGPLWLVYNYDSNPEFQSESIYARSVWQLDRIVISR